MKKVIKNDIITIAEVARQQKIAPIRVWGLIRQHKICYVTRNDNTYISAKEFNSWAEMHPDIVNKWRNAFSCKKERSCTL